MSNQFRLVINSHLRNELLYYIWNILHLPIEHICVIHHLPSGLNVFLFVVPHLLVESPCVNIHPSFLNDILISDGAQSTLITSYNP